MKLDASTRAPFTPPHPLPARAPAPSQAAACLPADHTHPCLSADQPPVGCGCVRLAGGRRQKIFIF